MPADKSGKGQSKVKIFIYYPPHDGEDDKDRNGVHGEVCFVSFDGSAPVGAATRRDSDDYSVVDEAFRAFPGLSEPSGSVSDSVRARDDLCFGDLLISEKSFWDKFDYE